MNVDVNDFEREVKCNYKDECYSARDNGAIMRHHREDKKPRKLDDCWTFGKPNNKNYLCISSEQVHRIMATAFHGKPATQQHIVDHIDTNHHNNRPENLRWLTKLENILNNPVTKKKIIYLCGSIEAFLADPTILPSNDSNPNFGWMRRVTKEEAQSCLSRMDNWVRKELQITLSTSEQVVNNDDPFEAEITQQGEWLFKKLSSGYAKQALYYPVSDLPEYNVPKYYESLTPNAVQENWKTPNEFSCCPQNDEAAPLIVYANQLSEGVIFSKNEYGNSTVAYYAISEDEKSLLVMCDINSTIKPLALSEIIYKDDMYVHKNLGSFFSPVGAEKAFTIARGLEWTGEDSIDDYH